MQRELVHLSQNPFDKSQGKDGMKAHPVYQLRSQLIAQRREHLKLLGLKRINKPLTVNDLLNGHDQDESHETTAANANGKGE